MYQAIAYTRTGESSMQLAMRGGFETEPEAEAWLSEKPHLCKIAVPYEHFSDVMAIVLHKETPKRAFAVDVQEIIDRVRRRIHDR